MKKLFRFVRKRWFLSLLGVLALATLVWFLGPLFAFAGSEPLADETVRWIVIGTLFGIWALVQIWTTVAARLRNRKMMDQLAGAPPQLDAASAASDEELETLRNRFDDALGVLKKSDVKHRLGGQYAYQLPWYLIIGPPGCGKTTALVNSGLHFPLAEHFGQDAIRGVGGTRNCDWWFTDEAVLLDTAGRYTTQDSYEAVDSTAWQGFLGLLKKHRPRRPINGVLVAVSLADLMQQTETERAIHARAIKQRVQELHQHLRIRFPVYVLFMKSDLVAGFMEFFGDLGQEERAQVWGMTFAFGDDKSPGPAIESFSREFDRLEQRLNEHLLARLQQERDPHKRGLIFAFPQQYGSLKTTAARFLHDVFQPSRFEENPLVRGVYFTSGTQTGAPIDRVMSALASNFGLDRQAASAFAGTGKSFFIHRLFRDVVFREAGLAGMNLRLERRRRWIQRGAYAGAIGIAILAALAWVTSYTRNQTYISEVAQEIRSMEDQIEGLPPQDYDPLRFLPLLNAVRNIRGGYGDDEVPLSEEFGLSQHDKLGGAARDTYRRMLQKTLLSTVILRLEDQIRQLLSEPDKLYEALRVYLMVYDDDLYDAETVRAWATAYWDHNWPRQVPVENREQLQAHLTALFGDAPPTYRPHEIDEGLVAQARDVLNRTVPAERVFNRLIQSGVGDHINDFIVSRAAGYYGDSVFRRRSGKALTEGIPALFTYDGYHQGFETQTLRLIAELENERWILGAGIPLAETMVILDKVRELYLLEYIDQWRLLLDDLVLVDARDPREAASILGLLSDKRDSPLRLLFEAVARETDLERKPEGTQGLIDKAEDFLDRGTARVEKLWQGEKAQPVRPERPPEHEVTATFSELHALVDTEGGKVPEIESVLDQLHPLYVYMNNYADRVGKGSRLLDFVKQDSAEAQTVARTAEGLPSPLGSWLVTLAQDSANMVSGEKQAELNRLWKADVLPFCRKATHNRYPFRRKSSSVTPLKDFSQLFGPNGELDRFFQENFSTAVDTSATPWRWVGEGSGISSDALDQFRLAATIREAFFSGGGPGLAVEFQLKSVGMDPNVKRFQLDLEGQMVDFRHEADRTWGLKWPVPEGPGRVRITFVDIHDRETSVTKEGPWAWFRILDRTSMRPLKHELFRVTFNLSGMSATFDLDALSVRNPFLLKDLRNFHCPERL